MERGKLEILRNSINHLEGLEYTLDQSVHTKITFDYECGKGCASDKFQQLIQDKAHDFVIKLIEDEIKKVSELIKKA